MIRSLLIALSSVLILSSCGSSSTPAREASPSAHTSTTHLVMTAHTPTPGDSGDFFIRWDIEDGEVSVGDTIDITEKWGRSISITVKSLSDSAWEYQKAVKWQRVSIYFDGDKSLYDTVSMDAYLVEKWGKYPTADTPTVATQVSELVLKWRVNGEDWEGKSQINPPPYYKYGSRAMMSPDMPIFKMSFVRESDNSSVNFDLLGTLKTGVYTKNTLYINHAGKGFAHVHETDDGNSNIKVEVTAYAENGNTATISGKITGTIDDPRWGKSTLDLEWKDAKIDVWGMEAK